MTYGNANGLEQDYGFKPSIDFKSELRAFAQWYKVYYGI